jgi:hypothetical protein
MEKYLIAIILFYYSYVIYLMFYMFFRRKKKIREKVVRTSHFRAYLGESDEELVIIQNHFSNQFQIPMIFLFASLLSIALKEVSILTIVLAGLFVLSRFVHSYIHLTYNNVLHRALSYFIGVIIVFVMISHSLYSQI